MFEAFIISENCFIIKFAYMTVSLRKGLTVLFVLTFINYFLRTLKLPC